MDAQRRRAAARIRSVIKDVREVVDARSTARRLRLFRQTRHQRGSQAVGPLEEELELLEKEFQAEGRTDEQVAAAIELCLQDCLKDMVGLSSPLHNLVNDSFAEGPGSAHAPGDKSLNEWLSGWAKQLDFAAAATLTLLRRALPLCGPGSNAVAILQTAHSMASAGAQLLPRYLLLEAAGAIPWQSTDEWLAKVLEMEALVLEAVGSGNVALVDIDSCTPDWLVHMLAGLAPIFDGLHQRRGLEGCSFTIPLCSLMAAVFTDSEALQPHAQALLVDWRLLEGLTQLLTAAHQELVEAPAWADDADATSVHFWSTKHQAFISSWTGCWPRLLARASEAGLQQQARALLETAGTAMLNAEAAALAALAEPQLDGVPSDSHRWVHWGFACFKALVALYSLTKHLLQPQHVSASASLEWQVTAAVASAAPHVVRLCSGLCSGQLMLGTQQQPRTPLADGLDAWFATCSAAAEAAREQSDSKQEQQQQQQQQQAEQQDDLQRAAVAATLASSLLQLIRLAPQLPSAINGCSNTPGCACQRCIDGGDPDVLRMDNLLSAALIAVDSCGAMAVASAEVGRRPAALLRLHSACTSVAHFLAGLQGGDAVILGLAYDEEGSVHLPLLEASQIVATLSCHVYDALLACQPDEEGAGGPWAGWYACFLLEMTAARSALEQRLEAFGLQFCDAASPHQRVLRALRALQCASGSDGDGEEEAAAAPGKAAAGAGEGDPDAAAADIVSLTQPLGDTFSAPLAKLLLRLLPPADGAVPALEPLSISETVLQAAALRSRRVCSYLRCPNLAAPGAGQAASKRCGACRQARYDCAACQRADWNAWHRHGCKVDAAAADVRQRRLQ